MNTRENALCTAIPTIDWHDFIKHGLRSVPALERRGKRLACAIGAFDGVHLGHRELLRHVTDRDDMLPFVLSFRDNPKHKTRAGFFQGELTSQRQRTALFASLGIDGCVMIDFSDDFSKLTGTEFLSKLVKTGVLGRLVVGKDFRCGRDLGMDATGMRDFVRGYDIQTDIVDTVALDGQTVSSSRIRKAIADGDLADAARLLGSFFEVDLADAKRERDGYRIRRIVPSDGVYDAAMIGNPYGETLCRTEVRVANGLIEAACVPDGAGCIRFDEGIKQDLRR